MPKVPDLKIPIFIDSTKYRVKENKDKRVVTSEEKIILDRIKGLNETIRSAKRERSALRQQIFDIQKGKDVKIGSNVKLYALQLEDNCWYVGMSFNVEKRFSKHCKGKGAQWTKLHKPIKIHEIRQTEFYSQDSVARLEDDMTLEYALKHGSDKVRGGGYCQSKPRWPQLIIQNEN